MNRGRSLKFGFALAALSLAGWATSHANAGGYCGRPASSSYYYNSGFSYGSSYGAYPVVVAPPAYSSFGSYSYYSSSRSYYPPRPSGFGFISGSRLSGRWDVRFQHRRASPPAKRGPRPHGPLSREAA